MRINRWVSFAYSAISGSEAPRSVRCSGYVDYVVSVAPETMHYEGLHLLVDENPHLLEVFRSYRFVSGPLNPTAS